MNIDLDELERKAKAASAKDALSFDEEDFSAYITPEIVCELINRLREAETENAALKARVDKGVRVGVYNGDSGLSVTFTENKLCNKFNAHLIIDEDAEI